MTGLLVLAVFVLLAVVWAYLSANLVLRGNRDPLTVTPATYGLPFFDETFTSPDGVSLTGWFLPAPRPTDTTVVVCHGWGANRSDMLERTTFLNTEGGYNLFYFDFRNHGNSGDGLSSLSKLEMGDLEAALDHLRATRPAESRRTALYGMSLGAAICLMVAAERPDVAGVVAESPFGRYKEVVARFGRMYHHVPERLAFLTLWGVRARLGFNPDVHSPLHVVHRIAPRPLFIIQGDADVRMPPFEGRRLFAAAGEPKTLWTLPDAHHAEMAEMGGAEFRQRVLKFYADLFGKVRA